jgi:hypothetical protein
VQQEREKVQQRGQTCFSHLLQWRCPFIMNDDLTGFNSLSALLLQSPVVVRVNATSRHGRLVSFLTESSTSGSGAQSQRTLTNDYWISLEVATYLAVQDFNERQSLLVPTLKERLSSCDLSLSIQMRDTEFSPIYAVSQYQKAVLEAPSTQTMAIVGSIRSTITSSLATISGTQGIPQISGLATSDELDDKGLYPFFARTIPGDLGDAIATCVYLQSLSVSRFAVLYVNDYYGVSYYFDIMKIAMQFGMEIVAAAYNENDMPSLQSAIDILQDSGLTYFVGILGFQSTEDTLLTLYNSNLLGTTNYTWLLSDSVSDISDPGFSYSGNYALLAKALSGVAVVLPRPPAATQAILQMQLESFASDKTRVQEFIEEHADANIFPDNFQLQPVASMGGLLFYDAVIALGIAACETQQDLFTGPDLYRRLVETSFEGASGQVSFVNNTGSRVATEVSYRIVNLLENATRSKSNAATTTAYDTAYINITNQDIEVIRPFIYSDGSSVPPPMAPPVTEQLNLLSTAEIATVYAVMGISALMSIACAVWTVRNRMKRAVRASQPIFLFFLCVGTLLISLSAIFQSFQEPLPIRTLNFGCNAYFWFVCIGFTTTFSALFSKTWRINRVYRSAQQFRRVTIRVRDVIGPFAVLFIANTIVLTTWMVIDPLNWRRIPLSQNAFGQVTSSYGTCFHFDRDEKSFIITLLVLNATVLIIANYESFKARNLPSEFNETFYIALTNAILLESSILGAPVIMLVNKQPRALFLLRSILLITASQAVLIPLFVPKMLGMDGRQETRFLRLLPDEPSSDGQTEAPRDVIYCNPAG